MSVVFTDLHLGSTILHFHLSIVNQLVKYLIWFSLATFPKDQYMN